ncbi:MAG: hypothetical protein KF791_07840 [Verrucomicrobiae bacterium]|nr:hypothetical protein [Verrucomicrobiae bacterium]
MNKNILALSAAAVALASTATAAVSSNIVGYVKLNLKSGLNLVTNPLDNTAANGNNVSTIFGGIDCSILRWTGSGFVGTDILAGVGVVGGDDFALVPGMGVFVDVGADTSVTTVGDALIGTQATALVVGNNFVSSKIPIAGTATELGLTPPDGSTVLTWTGTGYTAFDTLGDGIWPVGEPSFTVGQGFVVQTTEAFTWTKTFTVQ